MIRELIEAEIRKVISGGDEAQPPHHKGTEHKIVICQRGFVYAGSVAFDGEYLVITKAVNIRRWGTTKGLGELAASGNTADTVADPAGTVRVHQLAVVATLDCAGPINATT